MRYEEESSVPARIGIGMPVYNGERYLEEAILSILGQTYGDFVLIVSDNASTDRTEQICRDYASQDRRIVYTRNARNIGAARNYNRVFRLSSSAYFRWFNADDRCDPELHEKCVAVLDARPDVVLCCGRTSMIDHAGNVISLCAGDLDLRHNRPADRFMQFMKIVRLTNAIYGLMRTPAVARTLLMGDGSYPAADTNFMAELTLQGKFVSLPEVLFYRRMHPQAMSWNRRDLLAQRQFWTGRRAEYVLPTWRKWFAHLRAVRTAPITMGQKLRITTYLLRRLVGARRRLAQEVAALARRRFRSAEPTS